MPFRSFAGQVVAALIGALALVNSVSAAGAEGLTRSPRPSAMPDRMVETPPPGTPDAGGPGRDASAPVWLSLSKRHPDGAGQSAHLTCDGVFRGNRGPAPDIGTRETNRATIDPVGCSAVTEPFADFSAVGPAISLAISDRAPVSGDRVMLTAKVSPTTMAGTVRFFSGRTILGYGQIRNGTARVFWRVNLGETVLAARVLGNGPGITSPSIRVVAKARPRKLFGDQPATTLRLRRAEADRAKLRDQDRALRETRSRLRNRGAKGIPPVQTWSPMAHRGLFKLDDEGGLWTGIFRGGGDVGHGRQRFVYGDFDVSHARGRGPTAQASGTMVWEREAGPDAVAGIRLGAEVGYQGAGNAAPDGQLRTWGLSLGAYGARQLEDDLVLDVSATLTRATAIPADRFFPAEDAARHAVTLRGALTGERAFAAVKVTPELSFSLSRPVAGKTAFRAERDVGTDRVASDGATSVVSRLSWTPTVFWPVAAGHDSRISLAPRLLCEMRDDLRRGCGTSAGLGIEIGTGRGSGRLKGRVAVEDNNGATRRRLSVNMDFRF